MPTLYPFFYDVSMEAWELSDLFATQTAGKQAYTLVYMSLGVCTLPYNEHTNNSKVPEESRFFPHHILF